MKLSVLVGVLEEGLQTLEANLVKPHPSQDEEYYYNLERRLFSRQWKMLLAQLKAKRFNPDAPITPQQVKLITNHLKRNWDFAQSTAAVPLISIRDTVFTNVPLMITKFMDEIAQVTNGVPAYQLLMTTADFKRMHPMSKKVLAKQPLQDLQLTDDGKQVMHVTYDYTERKEGGVVLYFGETAQDGSPVKLAPMSAGESARLKGHSSASVEYYAKVSKVVGDEDLVFGEKLRLKYEYTEKQMDPELKVIAQYADDLTGFSGLSRVKMVLNKNVDNLFESREELYNHMRYCLQPDQWEDFIKTINKSVLLSLMTDVENKNNVDAKPADKIKTTITANQYNGNNNLFATDQTYADVVHLCMVMTYGTFRAQAGNKTSIWGGGYSEVEKIEDVNQMIAILTGKPRDGKAVPSRDDFFADTGSGAKNDNTLGLLFAQMCLREKANKASLPDKERLGATLNL